MARLDRLVLEEVDIGLGALPRTVGLRKTTNCLPARGPALISSQADFVHCSTIPTNRPTISPINVKPMPRLSQASPVHRRKTLRDRVESHVRPASPRVHRPGRPFKNTFGSRKAIPWPMPAGIDATAHAEPAHHLNRKASPVGSLLEFRFLHEFDCDHTHDDIDESWRDKSDEAACEADSQARPPHRSPPRCAFRHMIPSAAPRNSPIKPATVGNISKRPTDPSTGPLV